jgi:hypothetical protein
MEMCNEGKSSYLVQRRKGIHGKVRHDDFGTVAAAELCHRAAGGKQPPPDRVAHSGESSHPSAGFALGKV